MFNFIAFDSAYFDKRKFLNLLYNLLTDIEFGLKLQDWNDENKSILTVNFQNY
jgi:hypothetical protein